MNPLSFTICLRAALVAVPSWGFRHLSREHWQVRSVLPVRRLGGGTRRSLKN